MSFPQLVKRLGVRNVWSYQGIVRGFASLTNQLDSTRIHDGKVALVTGTSIRDGIGMGIARSLAKRGCNIILTGSRGAEKVDELRIDLESHYKVPAHYIQADLRELTSIKKLHDDVAHLYPEGVDILVNNAGEGYRHRIEEFPIEEWEQTLRINLTAPFYLTHFTLAHMKKKGWGRIINVSSMFGLAGGMKIAAYVSSKHGLHGLTKVIALETLNTGVTCNAICPASVDTETYRDMCKTVASKLGNVPFEEVKANTIAKLNPSGQYVEIEQIGELAAFLCSPAADQMTGTTIPMDAGFCAK